MRYVEHIPWKQRLQWWWLDRKPWRAYKRDMRDWWQSIPGRFKEAWYDSTGEHVWTFLQRMRLPVPFRCIMWLPATIILTTLKAVALVGILLIFNVVFLWQAIAWCVRKLRGQ